MRIQPLPVAPTPVPYRLDLTFEQVVALGVLSHRHEVRPEGGATFFQSLPVDVRAAVAAQVSRLSDRERASGHGVYPVRSSGTEANWDQEP